MASKDFSKFTQKYSLSKTLRFELKPIWKTQQMLDGNKVFLTDKSIKDKYIQTKPFFDRLHRDFVKEAFSGVDIALLDNFYENWKLYRQDKKTNEKNYKKSCENLRKEIVSFLDAQWKKWAEKYSDFKLKNKDIEILFEDGVFNILRSRYWDDKDSYLSSQDIGEKISIFDDWKGFTWYFTKFYETRKNYYKDDGTSTALATRIVDQNLSRFLDNLELLKRLKDKINLEEIKNNFDNIEDVFSLEFYNKCLLQEWIDEYNKIVGWYTEESWKKVKWINEAINLYRQVHKEEKIYFLKLLDKQIGSEKKSFLETIDSDEEFREVFLWFVNDSHNKIELLKKWLVQLFEEVESLDVSTIYLTKESINTISYKWTDFTKDFQWNLYEVLKKSWAIYDKKEDEYSFPEFIALSSIKEALNKVKIEGFFWKNKYLSSQENQSGFLALENPIWDWFVKIFQYEFNSLFSRNEIDDQWKQNEVGYSNSYNSIQELLKTKYSPNEGKSKALIKAFCDDTLRIYQMWKYFALEKKREWNPIALDLWDFYTHPEHWFELFYKDAYSTIVQWYNDVRNYLTKKPWSEDKWKLNFSFPSLLKWWDKDLESQRGAIILKKESRFYLAIFDKKNNWIFSDSTLLTGIEGGGYIEKMNFKQQIDVYRQLPRLGFPYKKKNFKDKWHLSGGFRNFEEDKFIERQRKYWLTEELLTIKDEFDLFQDLKEKNDKFELIKLKRLIAYYQNIIRVDYSKIFNVEKILNTQYEELNKLYIDFELSAYEINFEKISASFVDSCVNDKKLFLFQIYNKDFELDSKLQEEWYKFKWSWVKNGHTLYFESLFSNINLRTNKWFQLWAEAEIFFRPKSLKADTQQRKPKRLVTIKKRYTDDKILFHCPIKINANSDSPWSGFSYNFNNEVNNFLVNDSDINIIWVDRWEKHLAYYSVINQNWKIIESDSLNTVNGVNYWEKLQDTAERRKLARQDWQAVEGIKNLKSWYISAVVRKLADLAIKHNAIIVFEDLNMRFKQIRWGIEKSVYQQLEKALIEKLNFLVNKWEINPEKAGHLLNAYQLTAPFETFKDMGKQTGIIFYTQASYTSKIDPVTWWRPHLYLKYSSAEQAKKEILKFSNIVWNDTEKRFDFTYDIKDFLIQKEYPKNTIWTICTNVERYRWDKNLNQNKWDYVHYPNMTLEFESVFKAIWIEYKNENILEQIKKIDSKWNEKFFRDFFFFFSLVCQIRNTNKSESNENNQDFLLSPVAPFFDSRKAENWLPKNGDENGAYNIARKGLKILNKVNNFSQENGNCDKMKWWDLSISNSEWDDFASKGI